ncbi:apolipoprotein B-100 [Trichonephila clavipes]|nr:apolipoprotein B-100 [Trichonephila clavipes]
MHTDIHGTCPLTSTPLNDTKGSVRTSKDMLHCAFPSRKDWQFSPYSLFWNMSFIQNVISSTTDCDYDIIVSEKMLNKVNCKERHAITLQSAQPAVIVQSHIQTHVVAKNAKPALPAHTSGRRPRLPDFREYTGSYSQTSHASVFVQQQLSCTKVALT